MLHLSNLLRACGVDCNIDHYYRNSNVTDWSHWVSQSIQFCISQNGHILLVCSPAMFAVLEDTANNVHVSMAVSYIDQLALRNHLQQYTEHFLPLCIDDSSTSYVPPNLKGKTSYHFPYNKIPQGATVQQILNHPDFTSLRRLIGTLTGQQETPEPNVAPAGKSFTVTIKQSINYD